MRHLVLDQRRSGPGRAPPHPARRQLLDVEVGGGCCLAPGPGGDEHRRLRQPVGGAHHGVPEIEVGEPVDEALQSGLLDPLGTADDAQHAAQVEPRQVGVGRLAGRQIEGEVGSGGPGVRVCGQRAHPARRAFQEGQRTGQVGPIAAQDRSADAQHQAHVVVEGQPRHDRRVRRDGAAGVHEEAAHQLLEVHLQIAVREHDAGRCPGGTRAVLQVRDVGDVARYEAWPGVHVEAQGVDLDELGRDLQARLVDVVADI